MIDIGAFRGAKGERELTRLSLWEFELGEVINVGTVGTVYRAVMKETGREVAVKMLHPSVSKDPLITTRFEREMGILSKLNHPNIVHYHGGGKENEQYFYAMELLEFGTLKDLLERSGRFSWQETASCARQICSALQYAHNHGIIHRDLKPSNLFVTEHGQIKLGDFGTARDIHAADLTSSGMIVGTHAYMSPEQIRGERSISGHIDLYALGCVLFEMMVGRPPFRGENFAQLFNEHLNREPPRVRTFIRDCPPALDDVIYQLMAKNPERRPFNARQVQGVVIQLLDQDAADTGHSSSQPGDVGAGAVTDKRQQALSRRLARLYEQYAERNVSWTKLGVVAGLVLIACLVAWWFNNG